MIEGLRRRLDRSGQGLIVISHRPAVRSLCDTTVEVLSLQAGGEITVMIGERHVAAA